MDAAAVLQSRLTLRESLEARVPLSLLQQAQQLNKQRFNNVANDMAANKAFFMSFVRHPRTQTPEGFHLLSAELQDMKNTASCQLLVRQSEKRTEEATQLKRKRDHARFQLRQGKRHAMADRDTELAEQYNSGVLAHTCAAAEAEYATARA